MNLLLTAPIAYLILVTGLPNTDLAIIMPTMYLLASLPDEDQKLKSMPLFQRFVTHRGITHTVWFALGLGAVASAVVYTIPTYVLPVWFLSDDTILRTSIVFGASVAAANLAHLCGDIITPAGIRPFAPVHTEKYSFNLTTAKNKRANGLLEVFGFGAMATVSLVAVPSIRENVIAGLQLLADAVMATF